MFLWTHTQTDRHTDTQTESITENNIDLLYQSGVKINKGGHFNTERDTNRNTNSSDFECFLKVVVKFFCA